MQREPLDMLPGFRRRFRITPRPDVVCSELEDDFHCMSVTLRHGGGRVTSLEPSIERAPWSTCPGALSTLQRTFVGVALAGCAARGEKRANCTHLHDLATLAAAHAGDAAPLTYDILVSDPIDGVRHAELRCDGRSMLSWVERGGQIVQPAEIAGLALDRLGAWIASLEPALQEAARLLRWAIMVATGRIIPMAQQSDARRMPVGNCYTFQPDIAVNARRIGRIRDFSTGSSHPLAASHATPESGQAGPS